MGPVGKITAQQREKRGVDKGARGGRRTVKPCPRCTNVKKKWQGDTEGGGKFGFQKEKRKKKQKHKERSQAPW